MLAFKKGDKVRIKKGAEISQMYYGKKTAKRSYVVVLHDFDPEFRQTDYYGEQRHREAEVVWAGTGGYWCRTAAANVELVNG